MLYTHRENYWSVPTYPIQSYSKHDLVQEVRRRLYSGQGAKSKQDFVRISERHDLALLPYSNYNAQELREMVKDRRLPRPKRSGKPALIQTLERADSDRTFPRFLELPVDLRQNIYDYYFGWFEHRLLPVLPEQPPITRVGRQLRQETLKLFYTRCVFRIRISLSRYSDEELCVLDVSELNDASIFSSVRPEHLNLIRKWNLFVLFNWRDVYGRPRSSHFNQDLVLSPGGETYDLTWHEYPFYQEKAPEVMAGIDSLLKEVVKRPSGEKWQPGDLQRFREVLQTALRAKNSTLI